ncbi:proteasome-associated protein ECM29 homolog isoform X2 [Zootermopsis nevadensis]|uniref:Proteasome-associated protein ECM29-like protein n=1 Tax=Zootermopsis nevadensis TaxID=136037 RepID=A0A067QU84_ZOONE|nr:proteasome-associated protein ECM29 homolog isoform X2 [Zootermopsis nevadensis]KDR13581.1 Proteasome-associated protein ECM29-like protein [Zootermopsis nevadensis]
MANAADELTLLERVFLRIGSAESDEQLQSAISKFLPPVLLKLSSQQDGVRKKVMELLVHINKRIKSRPLVQLPVEALLLQYQDPAASSFVTNFTIIYIKLGYPRLPVAKQAELVPCVLNALEGKPQSHQDSLLLILMPVLGHVTVPPDPEKRSVLFGLNERPHIFKLLADFMLDMLLLPYGATTHQDQLLDQAQSSQQEGTSNNSASTFPVPPGMSEYSFKRVSAGNPLTSEELEQTKLGVVKFLASGVMSDSDILCHLVVAAADTRFSVANAADMELKKIVGLLDWGNVSLTAPLYSLFLGTQLLTTKSRLSTIKAEHHRSPASTRIRLKILPYLCRSRGPALIFPACIQVFFDSLYGTNTNPRLKNMALQFSMLIILGANVQRLTPVAGVLLSGLLKLIADDDNALKTLAYSATGKLGSRVPHLVNKDLALLQTFFEALLQEEQDIRMSVREALLSMVEAFRVGLDEDDKQFSGVKASGNSSGTMMGSQRQIMMQALLANQVESSEPMARFVAVRYAASVFPLNHAPSRYLLLLASGDSKDEVFTEALKALYGVNHRNEEPERSGTSEKSGNAENQEQQQKQKSSLTSNGNIQLMLPQFCDMARYLAERATVRMQSAATRHVVGNHTLPFSPPTFVEMLTYLRLCLARSADVPLKKREVIQHPSQFTPLISRYLRHLRLTQAGCETLDQYLSLIHQLLTASPSIVPLACLLEILGSVPDLLAEKFTDKLSWFKGLLFSAKEEIRETSALLYGIIIAHGLRDSAYEEAVQDLIGSVKSKNPLEAQHGCLLATAHALERKICVMKKDNLLVDLSSCAVYKGGVEAIVCQLNHQHSMLVLAACIAIGELAHCTALPLPSGPSLVSAEDRSMTMSKLDLVKKLFAVMNNTKLSTKVKEHAAKAAGFLCVGEEFPHSRDIIQGFLDMAKETRDVEVHFTAGEALVCCVQGVMSPFARDVWTTLESEYEPQGLDGILAARNKDLQWLLDELLNKFAPDPHPNSKQATGIWLLALLKHCPKREPVKQRLDAMQTTFMDLLSENSDIVQDVASKGLGLVYDCGDEESRSRLVTQLLDQLTSGRRSVTQVTGDTKLFEEGALGKSPTGGNLSTYKELCSLASDLNKPDLIYKFMQLANHNAIWNSKKGAAFGFSTIASLAGEQLSQYLPVVIPRLYRYQFDPTPKIQNSMTSIWHAIVPETQKTIDLYHKEILADLLANLTAPQWRVRLSCCLALADFLRGGGSRSMSDCVDSLPLLWTQLLRVMDDVHEGTRHAAENTTKVLSKLCVRCCDVSNGKAGEEMVRTILPVLLNSGICNTVSEVRAISLQTISQLVGSAGNLLKPHLPLLIPALLEATGELESRGLSQLSVQFGAERQTQEVIDSVRASVAKSHYTTETVAKCLQYVDASILGDLIPKVLELMKSSVGLGTRVACVHLIVLLSYHLKHELQPYTGKLLAALLNGLTDRNAAVRKNYAVTIGHLVSTAKDSSLEKLFAKIQTWYFEKEDESVRSACAYTLQAIGQHNQDVLKEHSSVVIPLVFFAMHANKIPDGSSVSVWEDVWHEATPGTESGIRQHAAEICELLKVALESPSWTMKAQAANAVGTVATKIGQTMSAERRNSLIDILVTGLNGRTWNGKENLLKALATICSSCKSELKQEEFRPVVDTIVDAMLKECRKEQLAYKQHALKALGDTLSALDIDRFDQVYSIVEDTLAKGSGTEESDDERNSEGNSKRQAILTQLTETVYDTLGKAWPSNHLTQVRYREQVLEQCVSCLANSTRPVQVAVVAALGCYVDRLTLLNSSMILEDADGEALRRILAKVYQALEFALGVLKHTRLRKEALNVLYLLGKKLRALNQADELRGLSATFGPLLEECVKDNAPEIKSRVVDIKNLLKS